MASHIPIQRSSGGRTPLGDGASRANVQAQDTKPFLSEQFLAQHGHGTRNESIMPNGTLPLSVQHTLPSPKNRRISTVIEEDGPASKRNSALSTTSTNASVGARKRKTHVGPWQLGQTIGKGASSRVRKVRHVANGESAVAKVVHKAVAENTRSMSLAHLVKCAEQGEPSLVGTKLIPFGLEREIVIMKLLNHPNIVRLYDVWENHNELYLIMEYVEGGELFEYVAQQERLDEREAVYLFRQIIAALVYCHRINIHHRDLKPENILLNLNTVQVKIIDFGMAALQPRGNLLTTPCGSPHYAAPEVIAMRAYDGGKADVWSCGVILFVMLTGYPPFNFPPDPDNKLSENAKLSALFQSVCRAKYKLPPDLSWEAQDLLKKIFVANPEDRISIHEVWHHPLLHKYDREWKFEGITLDATIGPWPMIDVWEPLNRKTIDREILRNLRTLWHSEKEEVLLERLTNQDPNQEKYFYSELLRYREENLENMLNASGLITHSPSDHRHIRPAMPANLPSIAVSRSSHVRSKSQYSVMNNEHVYSRHSFFDDPSEASYDPFRASREPISTAKDEYVNVTVHRGDSRASKNLKPQLSTTRQSSSLRIEALRRSSHRASGLSNTNRSINSTPARRVSTSHFSSASRSSMHSGKWLSGPHAVVVRPTTRHKRGVSFAHLHKPSTASGLSAQASSDRTAITPDQRQIMHQSKRQSGQSSPIQSSPPQAAIPQVRSKKTGSSLAQPIPRCRKMKDIDQEARKVSTELEKVCNEAFFRTSVSSSGRSSATDRASPFTDTPPSSVSHGGEYSRPKVKVADRTALANRPLPPLPDAMSSLSASTETPRTFTARELAEVRQRLAKTYAENGLSSDRAFNDLLKQLDNLIPPEPRQSSESGPTLSAAHNQTDRHSLLDVIPEEGRFADPDAVVRSHELGKHRVRALASRSVRHYSAQINQQGINTIRVVPTSSPPLSPSSPSPIAPLNIRKRSGASTTTVKSEEDDIHSYNITAINKNSPADRNNAAATQSTSKRSHWWKRDEQKPKEVKEPKPPRDWSFLDDRKTRREEEYAKYMKQKERDAHKRLEREAKEQLEQEAYLRLVSQQQSVESQRGHDAPQEKRGFFAFFKKKVQHVYKLKAEQEDAHRGRDSPLLTPSSSVDAGEAQNLLARIFRFKPEIKYLALQATREDVLVYIYRLLEAHSNRGLRDIRFNTRYEIGVTVDKVNAYGIRASKFVIEGFQILTDGSDSKHICAVRFTQKSGAASSMRKVVRKINKAIKYQKNEWLIASRKEARKICDCVKLT